MSKKNKISLQFKGFEELTKKIDDLAGTDGLKRAVEAALKTSKQEVNKEITAALQPSKFPAGGIYSTGKTKAAINKDFAVKWAGMVAEIPIGFDMSKSGGMTSIYLMYGTPRMKPDNELFNAIYGNAIKTKVKKLQETAVKEVIERIMGG